MPTNRPRHFVTESDDLAKALDAAHRWWPELSRAQLITRLALEGFDAKRRRREERLAIIRKHAGALTGVYRPDELEQLRADWPE